MNLLDRNIAVQLAILCQRHLTQSTCGVWADYLKSVLAVVQCRLQILSISRTIGAGRYFRLVANSPKNCVNLFVPRRKSNLVFGLAERLTPHRANLKFNCQQFFE